MTELMVLTDKMELLVLKALKAFLEMMDKMEL